MIVSSGCCRWLRCVGAELSAVAERFRILSIPTLAVFLGGKELARTAGARPADDIEALEIYVGISEIPAELDKNGKGICGVIVVWTRDPNKRADKP